MKKIHLSKQLNRSFGGSMIIFFFLILMGIFMALPLYLTVISAFKPMEEIFLYPPRFYVVKPTTKHFGQLFQLVGNLKVPITRYLWNSILLSILTTGSGVIVGALAAYPFAKKDFMGKKILWKLVMITLLFRGGANGLAQFIIQAKMGLLNTYWVFLLPGLASTLELFLMRQFMLQIPDALLEAARIDGASEFKTFIHVVLPNIKPAWMTVMVMEFTSIWNTSSGGLIFDEELKLLPNALSQISAEGLARTGVASAAGVLMLLPPIISFLVTQSKMLQTMAHSGIKD